MWLPPSFAVYPDGRVCISILHAPGDDPMGYESSAERWSPVQSVEKILLSVVSMLAGEPLCCVLLCEGVCTFPQLSIFHDYRLQKTCQYSQQVVAYHLLFSDLLICWGPTECHSTGYSVTAQA